MIRLSRALFGMAIVVQLVVLYMPSTDGLPQGAPYGDMVVHFVVFAIAVWLGRMAGVPIRWLIPVLAGHGLVSEIVQGLWLADRMGDPMDVVVNLVGVGVGAIVPVVHGPWRRSTGVVPR